MGVDVKKKQYIIGVIVFLIYSVVVYQATSAVVGLLKERELTKQNERLREVVSLAKSKLEAELFRDVFLADSLATVITIDPQLAIQNWTELGEKLMSKSTHVRNVGIAPNDVILLNYPPQGNERAIGLDFRSTPNQYRTVLKARELQDVFLSGPLELVQGGKAVIARFPVFNDYPVNNDYWGSISVVIDYPSLMEVSGFADLSDEPVAIRGVDAEGMEGAVFFGDQQIFEDTDFTSVINIPNGEWVVGAQFDTEIPVTLSRQLMALRIGLLMIGFLIFAAVFALWRSYRVVRRFAHEDELTGLYNRRFVMAHLDKLTELNQGRQAFAVVNIDLNGFKEVNDTYGHEAGDQLLRLVAHEILSGVRMTDIVARLGGDEFVVIMHRIKNEDSAQRLAESLRQKIEQRALAWGKASIRPSLSIGVAVFNAPESSVKDILIRADQAMYRDKANQRPV